jgi:DNA-binding beta-propeller fold protein YncE
MILLEEGFMNDIVRSGAFTFRIDVNWAKLPKGWEFIDVADVVVDFNDRVIVNSRSEHPIMIFDRHGNLLSSWGEGVFVRPHGMTIGPDGLLYCTDDREHTVKKFTLDGKLLQTIGSPGKPAELMSGEPFNQPTKVAFEPGTDNLYISDGYGNARIHKYTPNGERLFSWGQPGVQEGEFNFPHSVCTDKQGFVYVADRENSRIQVFDDTGRYITQWNNMYRACGLYITQTDPQLAIIGQIPTHLVVNSLFPNVGACVSIHDLCGKRLATIGAPTPGEDLPDQFRAPHAIAMDSHGDIYVGEVAYTGYGVKQNPPTKPRCLRKLIRLT